NDHYPRRCLLYRSVAAHSSVVAATSQPPSPVVVALAGLSLPSSFLLCQSQPNPCHCLHRQRHQPSPSPMPLLLAAIVGLQLLPSSSSSPHQPSAIPLLGRFSSRALLTFLPRFLAGPRCRSPRWTPAASFSSQSLLPQLSPLPFLPSAFSSSAGHLCSSPPCPLSLSPVVPKRRCYLPPSSPPTILAAACRSPSIGRRLPLFTAVLSSWPPSPFILQRCLPPMPPYYCRRPLPQQSPQTSRRLLLPPSAVAVLTTAARCCLLLTTGQPSSSSLCHNRIYRSHLHPVVAT
ncbi:hypothetical protein BHM03_00046598, partial [Ensete ventricosum]